VNNGTFVGGDGVGSMLERSADVINGRLAGFGVERSCLEQNISTGRGQPFLYLGGYSRA